MGKDKYPDADVRFDHAPYFNFNDGKVKFDTNWFDNANDNYGSASAFVPKSLHFTKSIRTDALWYWGQPPFFFEIRIVKKYASSKFKKQGCLVYVTDKIPRVAKTVKYPYNKDYSNVIAM